MIQNDLEQIREAALAKLKAADRSDALDAVRVEILGKKGSLTELLKGMKDVSQEDRPRIGQMVNDTRAVIENAIRERQKAIEELVLKERLSMEEIGILRAQILLRNFSEHEPTGAVGA